MLKFANPLLAAVALSAAPAVATTETTSPLFLPVYETNFPDPFIVSHEGRYLAYATNAARYQANVQMAVSDDLLNWAPLRKNGKLHDAMPVLPSWAERGWTWAPEVLKLQNRYLLYFTARERSSKLQCTGVAQSDNPLGPFVSDATEPLVCQRDLGGTIDASPFVDTDGQLYLYYKADANAVGKPTEIFAQRMTADGLGLVGDPVALVRNDQPWEAHVVESPTMKRHGDDYILFYSANHFGWEPHQPLSPYAMGYARCDGPMGPCIEAPGNPILYSFSDRDAGCLSGPGHQALFKAEGQEYIVFHAHAARPGCRNADKGRYMYIAPLHWQDGEPRVGRSLRTAPSLKTRR